MLWKLPVLEEVGVHWHTSVRPCSFCLFTGWSHRSGISSMFLCAVVCQAAGFPQSFIFLTHQLWLFYNSGFLQIRIERWLCNFVSDPKTLTVGTPLFCGFVLLSFFPRWRPLLHHSPSFSLTHTHKNTANPIFISCFSPSSPRSLLPEPQGAQTVSEVSGSLLCWCLSVGRSFASFPRSDVCKPEEKELIKKFTRKHNRSQHFFILHF